MNNKEERKKKDGEDLNELEKNQAKLFKIGKL